MEDFYKLIEQAFRNRSKLEIIYEMLELCTVKPIIKTDLLYKSNLSFFQLQRYLNILTKQGLIVEDHTERKRYAITAKGRGYVKTFQQLLTYYS